MAEITFYTFGASKGGRMSETEYEVDPVETESGIVVMIAAAAHLSRADVVKGLRRIEKAVMESGWPPPENGGEE